MKRVMARTKLDETNEIVMGRYIRCIYI